MPLVKVCLALWGDGGGMPGGWWWFFHGLVVVNPIPEGQWLKITSTGGKFNYSGLVVVIYPCGPGLSNASSYRLSTVALSNSSSGRSLV